MPARRAPLGVNTASLSRFLQSALSGSLVSQFREDNELIEIEFRLRRNPVGKFRRIEGLLGSIQLQAESHAIWAFLRECGHLPSEQSQAKRERAAK